MAVNIEKIVLETWDNYERGITCEGEFTRRMRIIAKKIDKKLYPEKYEEKGDGPIVKTSFTPPKYQMYPANLTAEQLEELQWWNSGV